jgi:hypothetical protein
MNKKICEADYFLPELFIKNEKPQRNERNESFFIL